MTTKSSLSSLDWIKCAFRALTRSGPQAIKAEALARELKVSKGSFYWHFKDVPALKAAMLKHWEEQATRQIITQINSGTDSAKQRLYDLVEVASQTVSSEYGGPGTEGAVRNWAQFDPLAQEFVERVDTQRLAYVEDLFRQLPATQDKAALNSTLLYACLLGTDQLPTADTRACLLHQLEVLISPTQ